MPAATPEAWAKARFDWETTPGLSLSEVSRRLGVAGPTVSIRAKRECWARVEVAELEQLDLSPVVIAQQSLLRLYRLSQDSKDPNVVLKACAMLLDRTMGRVVEPPPREPGEGPSELPELPGWVDPGQRLARQRGTVELPEALGSSDAPDPALPPSRPEIAAPRPDSGPARTPAAPTPRLQAVPKASASFWDSPSRPASGDYREVDRIEP